MKKELTISQLAKATAVSVETIRYYQRQKILDYPTNEAGSIRKYDDHYLEKIEFIKRCQSVGFSLVEIREIMRLRLTPNTECLPIRSKTEVKITEVEKKISELKRILKILRTFASKCDGHESADNCSILDGLKELKR
jgi:MerR family transcriptional regulator, copper efflux regulator